MRLATNKRAAVVCAACGRSVERAARQQLYCSSRCREKAKERSRKALLGGYTGAPPNPKKSASKTIYCRPQKPVRPSGKSRARLVCSISCSGSPSAARN